MDYGYTSVYADFYFMQGVATNLVGVVYGKLTVVSVNTDPHKHSGIYYNCKCSCGSIKVYEGHNLNKGLLKSCGDKKCRYVPKYPPRTHLLRGVWKSMLQRCYNIKDKGYNNYGGRGIIVCDKWQIYEGFFEDNIGRYETGLTLDRIDNNKEYSLQNTRWCTYQVQNRNTRHNKFTQADVDYIRGSNKSTTELLKEFPLVHRTSINDIKAFKTWKPLK